MENKLVAIRMEIKTSKSTSMTTNPRSEINEIEDIPLKASEMRDLRHPAKPIHQNATTLDATVIFNEESDEEDYHTSPSTYARTLVFMVIEFCVKDSTFGFGIGL